MKKLSAFLALILLVSTAQAARYKRVLHFSESDSKAASAEPATPSEPVSEEQVQAANNHKGKAHVIDSEILDLDSNAN